MQYAVPQFTDYEDKLIGPLTLKQFLVIVATGGVVLFFYSLLQLSIFFFFFAVPVGLLGLAIAFGKLNGRPLLVYIGSFISFFTKPQARIFKREEPQIKISFKKATDTKPVLATSIEAPESRLKKLAYLLDQKTAEERELIGEPKI